MEILFHETKNPRPLILKKLLKKGYQITKHNQIIRIVIFVFYYPMRVPWIFLFHRLFSLLLKSNQWEVMANILEATSCLPFFFLSWNSEERTGLYFLYINKWNSNIIHNECWGIWYNLIWHWREFHPKQCFKKNIWLLFGYQHSSKYLTLSVSKWWKNAHL